MTLVAGRAAAEGRVEGRLWWLDVKLPQVCDRLGGAAEPVHPGVLPLDRDRAVVADRVEHPEDVLPADVTPARGHEVPAPARIAPGQVRTHAAVAAVQALACFLAVHVVDPVGVGGEEGD